MAQRLEVAGFSGPQAAGAAEALAEALVGVDLATKDDLVAVESRLTAAIELLRRDITIKFGSMLMIAVGVLLAAIRYLPAHP